MQYDLREGVIAERPLGPGYELVPWAESALAAHARAKYLSFKSELDANVFPCLADADGCLRLMREISARRGFVPEATWLITYTDPDSGAVESCGTIQGIREHTDVGSIQNLGVSPDHRGNGLGSAILARSLRGFESVGIKFVTLEVTSQNYGALRLYERLGFRTLRTVFKSIDVTYG
ncbi:MAG: GNAT family N-acetyltransferase [Planctomycetota bacterium]